MQEDLDLQTMFPHPVEPGMTTSSGDMHGIAALLKTEHWVFASSCGTKGLDL